jgi:hypothetical protein
MDLRRSGIMANGKPGSDHSDQPKLNPGDQAEPDTAGAGENICRECQGTGRIGEKECPSCGGTGIVIEEIGGA